MVHALIIEHYVIQGIHNLSDGYIQTSHTNNAYTRDCIKYQVSLR